DDQWELDRFKASFAGAHIQLSGIVTNASAIRQWSFVQETHPAKESAAAWQFRLQRFAETLERIHFAAPPELTIEMHGDARDLQSFGASVFVEAPAAETPWAEIAGGKLNARLRPASSNGLSRAELTIEAARATSRWAVLTNFVLHMNLSSTRQQTNLVTADLALSANGAQTDWASGDRLNLTAHWVHSLTNPIPVSGRGRLHCEAVRTPWGTADGVDVDGNLLTASWTPEIPPDPSWSWWTNLESYAIEAGIRMAKLRTHELQAERASCDLAWRAPELSVTNIAAHLAGGELNAGARLNVATRALRLALASTFDPRGITPALPEAGRRWLGQFEWDKAPRLDGKIALVLPAWTNHQPDWRAEVLPSLDLSGRFDFPGGAVYRNKLGVTSARSHFEYSNMTWRLPDLTLGRPEGGLVAEHRADERTKEFYWRISSTVDPLCVRPFLDDEQQKGFDLVSFTQPPALDAEVWGRY
ncbi:MAG: hypothetical protein ACREIC_26485, partial [Limisphaerales bacterium]